MIAALNDGIALLGLIVLRIYAPGVNYQPSLNYILCHRYFMYCMSVILALGRRFSVICNSYRRHEVCFFSENCVIFFVHSWFRGVQVARLER